MSKPDAFLWVYDDQPRGLALVRGLNVREALKAAHLSDRARWSDAGHG